MSDTNLKTCVNYQMYHSVVQENHNVNIKLVFNLAKNFVYFWTVFTKHPVYGHIIVHLMINRHSSGQS